MPAKNGAVLYLILSVIGFGFIGWILMQNTINSMIPDKGISEQIVCGWTADFFRQPCRMKNRKYIQYSPVFHSFV